MIGGSSVDVSYASRGCGVIDTITAMSSVVLEGTECSEKEIDGTNAMSAMVVADEWSNEYGPTALGSGDVGDCSPGTAMLRIWSR